MKLLLVLITLTSLSASAMDLKPGLWNIEMNIKQSGKKIDPMAEMRKAMKDMPEAQKKQMMKAMGEYGVDMTGSQGMKQCFTKEMIEKAILGGSQEKGCKTQLTKKSSSEYITTYNCKDGTKGSGVLKIKSPKSYEAIITVQDVKGQKHEMTQVAKFLSSNCGDVKPIKL
jgi:hypothetical protein